MKALDTLNPRWEGIKRKGSGEVLNFDCPICGPSHTLSAAMANPVDGGPPIDWPGQQLWTRDLDTFDLITLTPSIDYPGHWHGWIEDGCVIGVDEAPAFLVQLQPRKNIALSPGQWRALKEQFGVKP